MKTSIIILTVLAVTIAYGQDVTTTAVPFLLISPSVEANGMAGISSTIPIEDPAAMISNPAQLGFLSLDRSASFSTYAKNTQWLPKFNLPDLTYSVGTGAVGINSEQFVALPFKLSLGVGYSQVFLNLRDETQVPESFHSYEKSEAISTAIGFEQIVRFGLGFNFKKIHSVLSPVTGEAKVSAYDVGFLLNVPLFSFIVEDPNEEKFSIYPGTTSTLDLSFAYTRNNIGDDVSYSDQRQPDPLPRYTSVGMAAEFGIISTEDPSRWKLLSVAFARQTEDLLVKRTADGTWQYQSGLGDIDIFNGLLLGMRNSPVEILTGWRINLYELFTFRIGWYNGTGRRNFRTQGVGVQLTGIWKLLESLDAEPIHSGFIGFLRNHLDASMNISQYYDDDGPLDKTKFFGVVITIR